VHAPEGLLDAVQGDALGDETAEVEAALQEQVDEQGKSRLGGSRRTRTT
jgi:hypothetical protein